MLEMTPRCNNNCVHCYINKPKADAEVQGRELSLQQIKTIIDEAASLSVLWVLLSGGEPLLRPDFKDIYLYLKQKGMLVTIFTNASLITDDIAAVLKRYPPREVEVTVYGVTEKTHKRVTRENTFIATMEGIDRLLGGGYPVTLKTTVMKSNVQELDNIKKFCEAHTAETFRYDPILQLRLDGDPTKNNRIQQERLSPDQIVDLERKDTKRLGLLQKTCRELNDAKRENERNPLKVFKCGAGRTSCVVGYDGRLTLCSSLRPEKYGYDLLKGSLADGWNNFVPKIMGLKSNRDEFISRCGNCDLHNLCSWCPAHADLETGQIDSPVEYFCQIAKKRRSLATE